MKVTVFGSARVDEASAAYAEARRLGALLGQAGHTVISGGYGGVMEAVSRGAHESGGEVVGVTVSPWLNRLAPNQYLSSERSAATLFERLEALLESDALIALSGGAGTLVEVALAWNLRQMDLAPDKPIILVGESWRRMMKVFGEELIIDERDMAVMTLVDNVEGAVERVGGPSPIYANWKG